MQGHRLRRVMVTTAWHIVTVNSLSTRILSLAPSLPHQGNHLVPGTFLVVVGAGGELMS